MARLFVVVLVIGIAVSGIVVVALPPISRRGRKRRAERAGARWVGPANFDASTCQDQAPVVVAALSGVGRLYGQRFSGRPDQRPVGGHLHVFADRPVAERAHAPGSTGPSSEPLSRADFAEGSAQRDLLQTRPDE
jgi:hypothetical protein